MQPSNVLTLCVTRNAVLARSKGVAPHGNFGTDWLVPLVETPINMIITACCRIAAAGVRILFVPILVVFQQGGLGSTNKSSDG